MASAKWRIDDAHIHYFRKWVPAFAGMTAKEKVNDGNGTSQYVPKYKMSSDGLRYM